jgi:hypothetical protein
MNAKGRSMKTRSQILSIGWAIIFCGLIFVSSASALDFEKWVDTWHSISVKQKGLIGVEMNGVNLTEKLKNFSANDKGYVKFTSFGSNKLGGYIYSRDPNGAWEALPFSAVVLFGDGADCVIKTENEVVQSGSFFDPDLGEGTYDQGFYFIARLSAKEKDGNLKSGKITGIGGYAKLSLIFSDYDITAESAASMVVTGKLVDVSKVPVEVQQALP